MLNQIVQLEAVACPFCMSKDHLVLSTVRVSPIRTDSNLVRCLQCNIIYINPRPHVTVEKIFYEDRYFELEDPAHWNEKRRPFFLHAAKTIEKFTVGRRLLDIGCGGGYFMDTMQERGWTTVGTEISKGGLKLCRQKGLNVHEGELSTLQAAPGSFDCITLWNVLDQLPDPKKYLELSHRLLAKGGILAVRVSNVSFHMGLHSLWEGCKKSGLVSRNEKSPTVFHLTMFSPTTLKMVMEKLGFKIERMANAPMDPQPHAVSRIWGPLIARSLAAACYGMSECGRILSFGTYLTGPSLLAVARKEDDHGAA